MCICKQVELWIRESIRDTWATYIFSRVMSPENCIVAMNQLSECSDLYKEKRYADAPNWTPPQTTKAKVIEKMRYLACMGFPPKWFGCIIREAHRLEIAYPCTADACIRNCSDIYLSLGCSDVYALTNIMTTYAMLRNYGINLHTLIASNMKSDCVALDLLY